MKATWSKIKSSGEWGVRIEHEGRVNEKVDVVSKSGESKPRFLVRRLFKFDDAEYWSVADAELESF